jgi:hypothetical protein
VEGRFEAWVGTYISFNAEVMRKLTAQFLGLAEKQRTTGPLLIADRVRSRMPGRDDS